MSTARRIGTAARLGIGLGVLGAAGYAFVAVVGHVFDEPADSGALSALISLYLLVNILGAGIFAALEQETSRAVSSGTALGRSVRPVARRAAALAAWWVVGIGALVVALWPPLLERVLDGRLELLAALLVAVVGSAMVYWVRGLLSGLRRFRGYARTLYLEGAARLVPCLVLLLLAVQSPGAYGLAFALGGVLAAVLVAPTLRLPPADRPAAPDEAMGRSLSYLVVAVALSQLVANLAPVLVTYRSPDALVAAGVFGATFVLARIPLFLFAPVQAVLVPMLTRAAALGKRTELVRRLRQAMVLALLAGGAGVVGCLVLGPWAAEVLFGTATRPSASTVGLLGLATLLMMAALVVQPVLVALGRQRSVTVAWVTGSLVYVGLLFLPVQPVTAALIAQLTGPAVVLVLLSAEAYRVLNRPGSTLAADHGSTAEAGTGVTLDTEERST